MSAFLNYLREQLLTERDAMDVVVKLLALADRPGSPHEGEVALQQATALAKKYGIDLDKAREVMKNNTVRRTSSSSSSVHPADQLFNDLTAIMKHVPGARRGERFGRSTTYNYFGTEVVVWGISHNMVTVMVVLPMNGEREHPTHWYLVLGNGSGKPSGYDADDVLAKSTNAQDVLNAIRSVDWDGIKKKRDQDRVDAENAAYNNAQQLTAEAQKVVNVALKYGYKLEPSHGSSYRYMTAEPYRLTIGPDGAWWHETRQGSIATDKWKYDTRRFDDKNKGPEKLEKWLTTKRKSGEAKFSVHDGVNEIVKVLTHYGFKPRDKQGNQHIWWNQIEKFKVQFGPNKLRGALSKTDAIFWMITAEYVRNEGPGGGLRPAHDIKSLLGDQNHGEDAASLEKALAKLMKSAEMGFDKIVAVCQKYGYTPNDKIAKRPDPNKEYFASPNGKYWVEIEPKTGKWQYATASSYDGKDTPIKFGHTVAELEQVLARFKPKAE